MRRPFLVGEKVYLRLLEELDIGEEYLPWLNNPEVTRYLETGKYPVTMADLRRYLERFQNSTTDLIFAVVDKESDKHIGNVTLNYINWIHRTADTGIMIGRKDFWGKGYAFEAWSLLIEYAFQRLGLRRIIAGAIADNEASINVLKKLGFKIEGTARQQAFKVPKLADQIAAQLYPSRGFVPTGEPGIFELNLTTARLEFPASIKVRTVCAGEFEGEPSNA